MLDPSHSPWFDCPQNAGEVYNSLSFTSCYSLQSPVTSSVLGPNTSHSILFSNTLSLRSHLNIRALGSQPYNNRYNLLCYSFNFLWICISNYYLYLDMNQYNMTTIKWTTDIHALIQESLNKMCTPYPKSRQGFKRPHFTGASWYEGQV
jgi:hypothetical protein